MSYYDEFHRFMMGENVNSVFPEEQGEDSDSGLSSGQHSSAQNMVESCVINDIDFLVSSPHNSDMTSPLIEDAFNLVSNDSQPTSLMDDHSDLIMTSTNTPLLSSSMYRQPSHHTEDQSPPIKISIKDEPKSPVGLPPSSDTVNYYSVSSANSSRPVSATIVKCEPKYYTGPTGPTVKVVSAPQLPNKLPTSISSGITTKTISKSGSSAMRKEIRMARNRESAALSRARKRELMISLEEKMHELTRENEKVKNENRQLSELVKSLQYENATLKKEDVTVLASNTSQYATRQSIINSANKSKTMPSGSILFSFAIFFSFLLTPTLFSIPSFLSPGAQLEANVPKMSGGENQAALEMFAPYHSGDIHARTLLGMSSPSGELLNLSSTTYSNVTRVLKALSPKKPAEWSPSEQGLTRYNDGDGGSLPFNGDDTGDEDQYSWDHRLHALSKQINARRSRNDSMIIVPLHRDMLFLPALINSKTKTSSSSYSNSSRSSPLRVSFVLPAFGEKHGPLDSVTMMQVDCRIESTDMFHLNRRFVPESLLFEGSVDSTFYSNSAAVQHPPASSSPDKPKFRRRRRT